MPRGPLAVAVATVAVCAVSTALLAPLSTPAVAAPPNPVQPRLAFTDDRDGLLRVELTNFPSFGIFPTGTAPIGVETMHEGEASIPLQPFDSDLLAFVSTRDAEPDGEVYVQSDPQGAPQTAEAVTCENDATESHPVVSPDGQRVAYATNVTGNWDIWVAERETTEVPAVAAAPGGGCAGWVATPVTTDPGPDLWPAWTDDNRLVFSSTRQDPLGDLYVAPAGAQPEAGLVRLTADPGADTQPNVATIGSSGAEGTWVAFSTTRFRADGSIAVLNLDAGALPPVNSPWPGAPPQSGEPAWAGEFFFDPYLAYTTTDQDPYGDVRGAEVNVFGEAPSIAATFPVATTPGVAESHGTWESVFIGSDIQASVVVTARSTDANISDVVAADGSRRRTIVDRLDDTGKVTAPFDEAGPAYSPEGTRVAYSTDLVPGFSLADRGLVVADADGSDPVEVPAQREEDDVDLDPVWSPDGTRLAFTRYRFDPGQEGYDPPQVWVVDLATGEAHSVSVTPTDVAEIHDTDPTWSPDGTRIALARGVVDSSAALASPTDSPSVEPTAEPTLLAAARAQPTFPSPVPGSLVVVDADDGGNAVDLLAPPDACPEPPCEGVPVEGRSPAWSPDGASIAYDDHGALRLVTLADSGGDGPDVPEQVLQTRTVIGFDDGSPTPSRRRISVAEDPAWSPDGAEIGFAGQPAGQPDQRGIYAIRPSGNRLRVIAQERGPETEPAYQPWADLGVTLTADPGSIPVDTTTTLTATVTNAGPSQAAGVVVTVTLPDGLTVLAAPGCTVTSSGAGSVVTCELSETSPSLSFDIVVRGTVVDTHTATATVGFDTPDPDTTNNEARADVVVTRIGPTPTPTPTPPTLEPADVTVRVRVNPPLGWVGGTARATFTVTNEGPGTADRVRLATAFAPIVTPSSDEDCLETGRRCNLGTLAPGESRRVRAELSLDERGTGRVRARVASTTLDRVGANNRAVARVTVQQPTLRLLPSVGPPGLVTMAYGEEMPPRAEVTLTWVPGITPNDGPFRVAADGTLRVPVLIMRGDDALGDRVVVARSVDRLFAPLRAEILVVPRSLSPPDFLGRG
jgi:uncharacterized repeat protein (TIGR01451 family)